MSRSKTRSWRYRRNAVPPLHVEVAERLLEKRLGKRSAQERQEIEERFGDLLLDPAGVSGAEATASECRTCGRHLPGSSEVSAETRKYLRAGFCSAKCAYELTGGEAPEPESEPDRGACIVCGGPVRALTSYTSSFRRFAREGFCSQECVLEAKAAPAPGTGSEACLVCGREMKPVWQYASEFRQYARQGYCSASCAEEAGVKPARKGPARSPAPVGSPPCRVCGEPVRPPKQVAPSLRPVVRAGFCTRACAEKAGFTLSTSPEALRKYAQEHPAPHRRPVLREMYDSRRSLASKFASVLELIDRISDAKGDPALLPVLVAQAKLTREDLDVLLSVIEAEAVKRNPPVRVGRVIAGVALAVGLAVLALNVHAWVAASRAGRAA